MVKNELFTNENRTTENVSENASENNGRDEEPDDGASQQEDGRMVDAEAMYGAEPENEYNSGSESTGSAMVTSSTHLRGYETDMHCYNDGPGLRDPVFGAGAVRLQRADEVVEEYRARIEDERERYMNKASQVTALKTELVYMADALQSQQTCIAGLRSTVTSLTAELRERTDELTVTRRELGQLAEDKHALNGTVSRTGDELNVLTAELECAKVELVHSRELLEARIVAEDRLTRDLDDANGQLKKLKRDCWLSMEKSIEEGITVENLKCTVSRLEHELVQSTAERNELQQRIEKQQRDTTDYVVDMARKIKNMKRENAELNLRIENLSKTESVDVGLQTDLSSTQLNSGQTETGPSDAQLVGTTELQQREDISECSCSVGSTEHDCISNYSKREKIQELQRELDAMNERYRNKELSYQQTIAELEKKVVKNKTHERSKVNEYKLDIKAKERQFADLSEEFKGIIRHKNEIINFERNTCTEIKKQLSDQRMLLELEKHNAYDEQIKCNEQMKNLVEKIDIQSKKIDELSNYIQEFKAQEIKADKPQEFRKTSKSVVYCDVAPKLKIPLLKKDTPKYNTCKLKNQKYTIETMTTVHPMCMDKRSHTNRIEKRGADVKNRKDDPLSILYESMQHERDIKQKLREDFILGKTNGR